ncbi:hypothetical protein KEJ26_00660 [Candidatus Bathyarchaeota archaeon]|nr:hypothetical protein [Candidatus Bathyarchaeota archaeon]
MQEVSEALKNAIFFLEDALKACVNGDDSVLQDRVWHAAAELEYAVFLLSLAQESENESWKNAFQQSANLNVGSALALAQDHLSEAVHRLEKDRAEAYRFAWIARGLILTVQDSMDKLGKQRSTLASSDS